MSLHANSTINKFLERIQLDFPAISFKPSDHFSWSAEKQLIYYDASSESPLWSLLHELGHMLCQHDTYGSDSALVRIEVEAWEQAKLLGKRYGLVIDEEHIQDCLDSYRAWQHKRSTCPACAQNGVEVSNCSYRCINCRETWRVSDNRFCRVYRRRLAAPAV